MAIKVLTLQTCQQLTRCRDGGIFLCLDPALILPRDCPEASFEYHTIPAVIICSKFCDRNGCIIHYEYTFKYDDALLVPGTVLTKEDILGIVADDCFAAWVKDTAGNEILVESTETGYLVTSQHGCEYPLTVTCPDICDTMEGIYGDGSDGDLVLSFDPGTSTHFPITEPRNFYYNNLTIDEGELARLIRDIGDGDTYLTYVLHVADTLTINGHLSADGRDGEWAEDILNPYNPGAGGTDYSGGLHGPGGGNDAGGAGGTGGIKGVSDPEDGFGPAGYTFGVKALRAGGLGGAGGAGGSTTIPVTPPGAGGTYQTGHIGEVNLDVQWKMFRLFLNALEMSAGVSFANKPTVITGGVGGGGGGGGSASMADIGPGGGGGGGGGASGGSIYIYAKNIIIGPNGRISANGGTGGGGSNGANHGGAGGGGGGGGGGLIYMVYNSLDNQGVLDVSGGLGGDGGPVVEGFAGLAGEAGATGEEGQIYCLNMCTGMFENPFPEI